MAAAAALPSILSPYTYAVQYRLSGLVVWVLSSPSPLAASLSISLLPYIYNTENVSVLI